MSDIAIRAENLGKRYRIGSRPEKYRTLRDTLAVAPARLVRSLFGGSGIRREGPEEFWALKNVSFEVRRGEVVGVIGRNGAGKSTLLKILSRITEPTEGYAEIHGRVGSLLEVGTGFHPELTGRENIFLNGAILGMRRSEIENKFDEIVDFAEVEKFIDTPIKHYSSGMYLRLAFAVAAHLEPEILLVDEVLAVGDAQFQKKCLGKMQDVAHEGRTVLFVSHNMAAISQLCQDAIWFEHGTVMTHGPSGEVVTRYLSEGSESRAERCWKYPGNAPGDDRIRLLAVRAVQSGRISDVLDINEPWDVELEFAALREVKNLVIGISFFTEEGICLFNSCDWRPNRFGPGVYIKKACLFAPLFAEGRLRVLVQLVFYDPNIRSVVVPDALILLAVDSNHPRSVRGHYKGRWPGVVRISLPWGEAIQVEGKE
jgi:lipopolysaccharide transport system ATP-binding protein